MQHNIIGNWGKRCVFSCENNTTLKPKVVSMIDSRQERHIVNSSTKKYNKACNGTL